MFFGIFFLFWRRKKIVFRIIVDHGLCQNLIILMPLGCGKLGIHECCHLIHVKIDIRDIFRFYIVDFVKFI